MPQTGSQTVDDPVVLISGALQLPLRHGSHQGQIFSPFRRFIRQRSDAFEQSSPVFAVTGVTSVYAYGVLFQAAGMRMCDRA